MTNTHSFSQVVTLQEGAYSYLSNKEENIYKMIIKSIYITASNSLPLQTNLKNWCSRLQSLHLINHI